MSTSQLHQSDAVSVPPRKSSVLDALPQPLTPSERLPTPLERTQALVLAHRDRRNLLGRWLTLMGVGSCRTAPSSTPLTSLTPLSSGELVLIEATENDFASRVASLRTRGWQNIVVLMQNMEAAHAARALQRDIRVVLRGATNRSPSREPQLAGSAEEGTNGAKSDYQTKAEARELAAALTRRERIVLQLVARGKANREIGDLLKLSPLTIKSHLARISRKLQTGDRASMVLIALRAGVIS